MCYIETKLTFLMVELLPVGSKAPDFMVESTNGNKVSLADFAGKKLVLYFYPKDNTPGCTKEACNFRDISAEVAKKGAIIVGVSKDNIASHNKFKDKYHLNFDLLADTEGDICTKYKTWAQKSMFGKKYMGILRATYIIDEKGIITQVFPKVNPLLHAREIIAAL